MQNLITSKNNEKISFLSSLNQKKYRDRFRKFLVENLVTIYDALNVGIIPESIYVTKELLNTNDQKVKAILNTVSNYFVIDEKINKVFSSLDTPSGICAVFKKIDKPIDFTKSILYLNGISDPGNLGTILRTAIAFDIKNIVADNKCVDVYNPKTISAAKDAVLKLNVQLDINHSFFSIIKKHMKIIVTSVNKGEDVNKIRAEKPFCLVLGSESHGVNLDIQKLADTFVNIKISKSIESLNVAVATGILLYSLNG